MADYISEKSKEVLKEWEEASKKRDESNKPLIETPEQIHKSWQQRAAEQELNKKTEKFKYSDGGLGTGPSR